MHIYLRIRLMFRSLAFLSIIVLTFGAPTVALQRCLAADEEKGFDKTLHVGDFEINSGFFTFFWDDNEGKVWLEVDKLDSSFLYVSSLATGLGSNPVGLDRGQLSSERVVHFKRVGKLIFLVQENLKYRASTQNEPEKLAIQESFAESILWSGESRITTDGKCVVDITDFLLRDAHDCIGTLASSDQGTYSLDKKRSYVHLPRTKAFPGNSEFEVALTFGSSKPGRLANRVAADGKSITLRQHHSLVKLPDPGYRPRKWDPRVGCFSIEYADYSVPIEQPIEQRLISRHRLEKVNPGDAMSPAKEPIVYYVDPGVPQPIRDALLDGASWWNEAFESAGFQDAFQVRVLPDDVDPMDVRYNVIQWVHRATRGWSYGQTVTDPRTGEIIKGHVLLGSLRVRQDHLLFENFLASPSSVAANRACSCGLGHVPDEAYLSQLDPNLSSTEVALARIRQLSAHEVGHTLGFAHNFAASTYGDRASVMDYPAPRAKIVNGSIDLSDAYGVGIGGWDKFAVQYAYAEFPDDQEATQLSNLIQGAIDNEMLYITDADARSPAAAHPLGNLWDNGTEPVEALKHEMQVRRIAMAKFDDSLLQAGEPLSELEKSFVPVYLHHRYQVEATAKMIGGYEYTYAVKNDGQVPQVAISAQRQIAALEALLATLDPSELVIPQRILNLIPPRVSNSASDVERFSSKSGPIFDATSAIQTAAELTIGNLLQPQRASRIARNSLHEGGLSIATIVSGILRILEPIPPTGDLKSGDLGSVDEREVKRVIRQVLVDKLITLADSASASDDARAAATAELTKLTDNYYYVQVDSAEYQQHARIQNQLKRFLNRPYTDSETPKLIELPPGSPIGLNDHK